MNLYHLKILFSCICLLSINIFADSRDFKSDNIREEINRLKEIRDKHPEEYQHQLHEYQQSLRDKMRRLKKNNPEKYKEIQLKLLRQKHSFLKEKFDKYPDKRVRTYSAYTNRLHNKLLFLKENDPEAYERLKERISEEREKRFKGNGQGPPPIALFDQIPHGKQKHPEDLKKKPRKDMQKKIAEIEDKIYQLPPEQQKQAKARLEKKLAERHENFKKLELKKDSKDFTNESKKKR